MIGVICEPHNEPAVREFFQLFKTPWAMFDSTGSYAAVIVSTHGAPAETIDAGVVIHFGANHLGADMSDRDSAEHDRGVLVNVSGTQMPIFCGVTEIGSHGRALGWLDGARTPIAREADQDGRRIIECGYDLFAEIAFLLDKGQPAEHARTPTLDLHIAVLRRWLLESRVELIELPPKPPLCGLLATLTHDVDFMGIRRHTSDRTLLGFLYRATLGSILDVAHGRATMRKMLRNWWTVLTLPLVYLKLLDDFWLPFARYERADAPWRSTFFIVPFGGRPGRSPGGNVIPGRTVPYGAADIARELRALVLRGHEIALHGIDAWSGWKAAGEELAEVEAACDARVSGVRMHWLYFDSGSPLALERAGLEYDATVGYNDAVGFRAGTAQVYAPLGTERLLELPLILQDTSLLYPSRMHCGEKEALAISHDMLDLVQQHGGVATVSWHERSLAPERLWDRVYRGILTRLRSSDASVRPAREAVDWFRARRGVDLEGARLTARSLADLASPDGDVGEDAVRLRLHHCMADPTAVGTTYTDLAVSPVALMALIHNQHAPTS